MSAAARVKPTSAGLVHASVHAHSPSPKSVRLSALRKILGCKQVAAVCYRVRRNAIEFLLVQTRSNGRWTFPKGNAEPGLTHAQAAALEAFEEAGVHGRIEEVSFAHYFRRAGSARASTGSSARNREVSAHLCRVSRLCTPKESDRGRTWFSVHETKKHLREGRKREEGDEFAHVVDKAVSRIQRSLREFAPRTASAPRWDPLQFDALQRVQFEATDRFQDYSAPKIKRNFAEAGFAPAPVRSKLIDSDVLPFLAARAKLFPVAKKMKALGTGSK